MRSIQKLMKTVGWQFMSESFPLRTNQLIVNLDLNEFSKVYDILRVYKDSKKFNWGSEILDAPLSKVKGFNVCSVFFAGGKAFYVLMNKDSVARKNLQDYLKNPVNSGADGEHILFENVDPWLLDKEDKRVIPSLLLNALSSGSGDYCFSNCSGHLYCSCLKINGKKSKWFVPNETLACLEVRIYEDIYDKALRLDFLINTFTNTNCDFLSEKARSKPKYILSSSRTPMLRRKLKSDKSNNKDEFVIAHPGKERTNIPFLELENADKFEASKMGVIYEVLSMFNKKYEGICRLDFAQITDYERLDSSKSAKGLMDENIKKILSTISDEGCTITIVDMTLDRNDKDKVKVKEICSHLQSALKQEYDIDAKIIVADEIVASKGAYKDRNKDKLYLCVIHNQGWYMNPENGANDPYRTYPDLIVQHVTVEDFAFYKPENGVVQYSRSMLNNLLEELLIKRDLVTNHISIFDWAEKSGIKEKMIFGVCDIGDAKFDSKRFYYMTIFPDGSFKIEEQEELNCFTASEFKELTNIFYTDYKLDADGSKTPSRSVKGIIKYDNNNIDIIRNTYWRTIPEIEKIAEQFKSTGSVSRSAKSREELFQSITDINMFEANGHVYYFCGIVGNGMDRTVQRAANIRKIEPHGNHEVDFKKILPLMMVTFVRNGQLTVLPFPFKYLREYIDIQKCVNGRPVVESKKEKDMEQERAVEEKTI